MVEGSKKIKRGVLRMEDIKNEEEIMDYFTRQVLESGRGNRDSSESGQSSGTTSSTGESAELAITDSFGFVEKTLGDQDTSLNNKVIVKKLTLPEDKVLNAAAARKMK